MASTSASRPRAPTLRTRCFILLKASSIGFRYRVQIRRVGGQEHEIRPPPFDELADLLRPVRT